MMGWEPWLVLFAAMGRYRKPLGTVIVGATVVLSSVAIYQTTQGGGGAALAANLFVDGDGGTCTWSSTEVEYSDAAACASLDAAFDVANTNSPTGAATVGVKAKSGGASYGKQTITGDRTGTGFVTFRAESGVRTDEVAMGTGFVDGPDYLEIQGPEGGFWVDDQGISCVSDCQHVTVTRFDGGALVIDDFDNSGANEPANWIVQDSDFGPCAPNEGPDPRYFDTHCNLYGGNAAGQIEITGGDKFDFFNNTIHDFDDICSGEACDPPGDVHFECMRGVGSGAGIIRGNRFWGCEIYAINPGPKAGPNLVIENNWFGGSDGTSGAPYGFAVGIADVQNGCPITIRNNSFQDLDGVLHDVPSPGPDCWYVTGNLIGLKQCITNVVYAYNIYDDNQGTCGGTGEQSITGEFPYSNGNRDDVMNYHITGSSWEGDGAVTSGCSSVDYDGESRGSTCDAGSDERP